MFRLPFIQLILLILLPVAPLYGAQSSDPDSLRVIGDAHAALRSHIHQVRQLRGSPGSEEGARDARREIIRSLDGAGALIPGDDWIVGHRVGLRVLQGDLDDALSSAQDCRATPWWCGALRGFVLHTRGGFVEAENAFDASLQQMPIALRCEWLDVIPRFLLEGSFRREFRRLPCPDRIEEERRVWWLADPLYLMPGNDRKTEHYARMVAMELHHQWLELEGDQCDHFHHLGQIKQGWPDWGWSIEETSRSLGDGSGYRFIPRATAGLHPFESSPEDWSLNSSSDAEWYDPPYGPIYPLDPQVAFFRRGDLFLATVAADITGLELDGDAAVDAAVLLTRDPDYVSLGIREEGPDLSRYVFEAMIPAEPHLVSVELLSRTEGAGRSRFGHSLPDAPATGPDLSDILLWNWSDGVDERVEAVLPRMLGSSRISAAQELGVFWELYGVNPGDVVDVSISAQPQDRGILSRVTDFFRITSPPQALRLGWSEGVPPDEASTRGRTIALNMSQLPPGRYSLELRVGRGGGEPVVRTKEIELYR